MKTTLIITGQLRLQENQTPTEKINYHIEKINPDETILFLWENEYKQYKNEIDSLNLQKIIAPENLPIINQDIKEQIYKALNNQPEIPYNIKIDQIFQQYLEKFTKQSFQIQYIFQNINNISDIYIKTRYDNIYLQNFEIKKLKEFYNENKPIIATPFGGDYANLGLGDILTITNNKANKIYQTYYDTILEKLKDYKTPITPELTLRYIFKNLNDATIYRFHCIMTTEKYYEKQLITHANKNLFQTHGFNNIGEIIGIDNKYLINYEHNINYNRTT